MNSRLIRIIIGWNVVLTLLLLGSAAANVSSVQASFDPPVRVFNSNSDLAGGAVSQTDQSRLIDKIGQDELLVQVQVHLPAAKPHMCMAFASAEAVHLSGKGTYNFRLERDGSVLPSSVRRVELLDNAGIDDDKYKEVSTAAAWADLTGDTTIRFVVRKTLGADPDMAVDASSLTVICLKKVLN